MSGRQTADPWRDAQGFSPAVRARVEQTDSDAELVRCVRGWASGVECCREVSGNEC
jgi:hypothetical protein